MEGHQDPVGAAKLREEQAGADENSKKPRRTRWGAPAADQTSASSPAAPAAAAGAAALLPSLSSSLQAAAGAARQALEKAKRAALIQKQIQEQLKACQGLEATQRPRGPAAAAAELTGEKAGAASSVAAAQATALAAAAKAKREQLGAATSGGEAQPLTLRALLGVAESRQEVGAPVADPSERQRQLFVMLHEQQLKKKQEAEEAEKLKQEKLAAALKARPRPLRFDQFGREIDEEGKVVPLQKRTIVSDLKINRRAQNEGKVGVQEPRKTNEEGERKRRERRKRREKRRERRSGRMKTHREREN
ncbi:pre-mRNA processing factor PRP3 [Toxoplasma gondii GT1]|uniref:Pre-mRNA processing factor PRP3 n=1 Tax=Toxoplasma gondii (strain ATCC 50853 / GT1) TaxID=507601 RepID=S7V290_TOXGG|nr:pre-mRNA processing factor PRP3 [Toxoplasma gondii GT1]